MAVATTLATLGAWILGGHIVHRILNDAAGDPEGKLAAEVAKEQFFAQQAMMEPFQRQAVEAEMAPRYEMGGGMIGAEAGLVKRGLMNVEIAGPESRELMGRVAARMGISPQALANKINPMRAGDFSSLSKAAFGRTPIRAKGKTNA